VDIKFRAQEALAQNRKIRKIGNPNNLKFFGSNKTKVPKQDSQNNNDLLDTTHKNKD
jgi:hypothetical protein